MVIAAEEGQEKPADFEKLQACFARLDAGCTLGQVLQAAEQIAGGDCGVGSSLPLREDAPEPTLPESVRQAARRAAAAARHELQQISFLSGLCRRFSAMDFRFLFHPQRKLLAVGFNVNDRRRDESHYDLLASEARLTSFLAVSHGQLPLEHWFALGRMVTVVHGTPTLLSWSGSMFEYLLPMLIMPSYRATLLDATCRAAVKHQMRYARRRGVPWGISESCSSTHGAGDDYGYRAFGVPGLGLAPDLGEHLVIAPYASALALVVAPREACANLARLEQLGYLSSHGFYDAIDYTAALQPARQPAGTMYSWSAVQDRDGPSQRHDASGAGPCAVRPDDAATLSAEPALRCARYAAAGTCAAERLSGRSGYAPSGPAHVEKKRLRGMSFYLGTGNSAYRISLPRSCLALARIRPSRPMITLWP